MHFPEFLVALAQNRLWVASLACFSVCQPLLGLSPRCERRLERAHRLEGCPPALPDCRMRRSASSTTSNRHPVAYPAGGVQRGDSHRPLAGRELRPLGEGPIGSGDAMLRQSAPQRELGPSVPNARLGHRLRTTPFTTDCVFLSGILMIPKGKCSKNRSV